MTRSRLRVQGRSVRPLEPINRNHDYRWVIDSGKCVRHCIACLERSDELATALIATDHPTPTAGQVRLKELLPLFRDSTRATRHSLADT